MHKHKIVNDSDSSSAAAPPAVADAVHVCFSKLNLEHFKYDLHQVLRGWGVVNTICCCRFISLARFMYEHRDRMCNNSSHRRHTYLLHAHCEVLMRLMMGVRTQTFFYLLFVEAAVRRTGVLLTGEERSLLSGMSLGKYMCKHRLDFKISFCKFFALFIFLYLPVSFSNILGNSKHIQHILYFPLALSCLFGPALPPSPFRISNVTPLLILHLIPCTYINVHASTTA